MKAWGVRLFSRVVLLGIVVFFYANASGVIIVVHGTFATAEPWHQAEGDFVQALRASFAHLPDGCSQKNAAIISFSWTGANCSSARITAAKNLSALILSYPVTEKIQLVAHSHAGNVAALTTQFLKKALEIPSETRGVAPLWSLTEREASELVGLPCTAQDCVQLQLAVEELAAHAQYHRVLIRSVEPVSKKIQRIYFLATPVDVSRYACEMSMVETCYALFSKGDLIQPVVGFYQRVFPQAPRFLNLEVVTLASAKKVQLLGHTDLRKPRIGSWLLLLPYLIEECMGLTPENYGAHKHIVLALLPDGSKPIVATQLFDDRGKLHETVKAILEQRLAVDKEVSESNTDGQLQNSKHEKRPIDPFPVLM